MKKTALIKLIAAGLLFSAASATAMAAPAPGQVGLRGDVKVEKTVSENGIQKVVLADTSVVVPGDRLVFSTYYVNNGNEAVQNFVVTSVLSGAVLLTPESADTLDLSVDGGKTFGKLATLTVDDGKGGHRPAVAGDATHVRWTIPAIAPRQDGKVEFHAIVR